MFPQYIRFLMRIMLTAYFLIAFVSYAPAQSASVYSGWGDMKPGTYGVGFRLLEIRDTAREDPSSAAPGTPGQGYPMQIGIWYPSSAEWTPEAALPFRDYFLATERKNDFQELTEEEEEGAMEIFRNFVRYGLDMPMSEDQLAQLGRQPTASLPNAPAAAGPFPVILAGHDGGIWKNTLLYEYLAGHGFVVVSTGFLSSTYSMLSSDPSAALERRIGTLEYVHGMLPDFPFADADRVGLMGLNADGMSMMLFRMKTGVGKAVVSIDGWEGKNNGFDAVRAHRWFRPDEMDAPYLEFQQHEDVGDRHSLQLNQSLFNRLEQSDRYSFILKDMGHAWLTGNMRILPEIPALQQEHYRFMWSAVLRFFRTHLTGHEEGADLQKLMNGPDRQPELFIRAERRASAGSGN